MANQSFVFVFICERIPKELLSSQLSNNGKVNSDSGGGGGGNNMEHRRHIVF